jgi:arylsulfatase A-like enzyme
MSQREYYPIEERDPENEGSPVSSSSSRNNNGGWKDYVKVATAIMLLSVGVVGLLVVNSSSPSSSSVSKASHSRSSSSSTTSDIQAMSDSLTSKSVRKSSSKPNVVFLLADDLGWNGIGYYEPTDSARSALQTLTPNLQSLAKAGVALTNYYAMEVCTPSRASFLTGRYPINLGMQYGVVQPTNPWALGLDETLLPEVLKDYGDYDAHILGKWHLGHQSERYLPTARGFDSFVGYLDGDNYYYSKNDPTESGFSDFMVSNATCYGTSADSSAYTTYSTVYYQDLAVDIINDYATANDGNPLFLYVAFQAVHNPFLTDDDDGSYGTKTYALVDDTTTAIVADSANFDGEKAQLYALTLNILDTAVGNIVDALDTNGMMDNTIVIFASDNGGCYCGGAKNAPFKGSKASLFEGGSKVDAFIYSPTLLAEESSTLYSNLFHVSDWFPTILDMAGISYESADGYALDGVSHYAALTGDSSDAPRTTMLYNAYAKVLGTDGNYSWDLENGAQFAIRGAQYKLVHTYNGSTLVQLIENDEELSDDATITVNQDCKQGDIPVGSYQVCSFVAQLLIVVSLIYVFFGLQQYLFDLINDPYETTNLIDATDDDIVAAKVELYALLDEYVSAATEDVYTYVYYQDMGVYTSTAMVSLISLGDD